MMDLSEENIKQAGGRVYHNPPKAHYTIECSVDPNKGVLEGTENIHFENTTNSLLRELRIKQTSSGNMEVRCRGETVRILSETKEGSGSCVTVVELPEPIHPGGDVELQIQFGISSSEYAGTEKLTLTNWYPRLWWGVETHDEFDVKVKTPPGYGMVTSGAVDSKSGYYHADNVRTFGLFLGRNHKVAKSMTKDVLVQVIFTPKGKGCADLLLETAVDVINFYFERFGFYPHSVLSIIPGMNRPAGGYPVATSIVAVHGMEQFDFKPKLHWQWITAHEIGHEYWGEHVLSEEPDDAFNWLMIGLGIYADREYARARGLGLNKHREMMNRYIKGVQSGFDTTIALSPEQRSKIIFDFNNIVKHGKSFSVISALDCVLGKKVFGRIYQNCLKDFGGRRLGINEFKAVCEKEAGQDLGWFFDQWINSNKFLSYKITSHSCKKQLGYYICQVEVKCLGDLKMPVPVSAYFEDGTSQSKLTDRLLHVNVLEFKSKSPLKEVRLDPEAALAQASME
ncbi:MAG: hypothetical protein GWN67_01245 [Phycisphaerae bacterium]|nr:M1 family metallopeptidase [Phycisphaerae bacterium]NIP50583.1 M1 family metallopeptidase [Phycisphaerae bacterium]NIS50794.1 M1 family metallopeptidase [Phycisphaerae bacterium]NIU07471.1 M1 family metallopeptidase [Phycisphaerae bacterium]NIU55061.1 hypothetical protein [Phycisphaerae bacterium]